METCLFGKLLLTEFVEDEELSRENDVLLETARRKLDALDDLTIGNHHRNRPELHLQVLGKFLASGVSGIL